MLFNKVNTHEANEFLNEIEPMILKYDTEDIGIVCAGVLTGIVHSVTKDTREDLIHDITKLIRSGVEHLDNDDKRRNK